MVNRGEEKVRVHMNVVPRSTVNNFLCVCTLKLFLLSTFSVRPRSSVGRITVDLIRRSGVRFPAKSKDFFFTSCGSLIPFTRAKAKWVIHGLN